MAASTDALVVVNRQHLITPLRVLADDAPVVNMPMRVSYYRRLLTAVALGRTTIVDGAVFASDYVTARHTAAEVPLTVDSVPGGSIWL